MSSYTLPHSRCRTFTVRIPAAPRDTARIQGRVMKLLGWATVLLVFGLLVWLNTALAAFWARALFSLLLATIGLVVGMRVATRSTSAYIADLQRVNKVLCDQRSELEEVNAILLKQINADAVVETTSPSDERQLRTQQELHG